MVIYVIVMGSEVVWAGDNGFEAETVAKWVSVGAKLGCALDNVRVLTWQDGKCAADVAADTFIEDRLVW